MTKKQLKEHKIGNQKRRAAILRASMGKKWRDNPCVQLGGVCQIGKYSR